MSSSHPGRASYLTYTIREAETKGIVVKRNKTEIKCHAGGCFNTVYEVIPMKHNSVKQDRLFGSLPLFALEDQDLPGMIGQCYRHQCSMRYPA